MAIKALDIHTTKKIVHPDDKEEPTTFVIGALDSRVFGKLNDRALTVGVDTANPDGEAAVKLARNEFNFEVVQFGLKGFEHYVDSKGDEVKFKTEQKVIGAKSYEVCHSDILTTLPGKVLSWLSDEIMKMNSLGSAEGNS